MKTETVQNTLPMALPVEDAEAKKAQEQRFLAMFDRVEVCPYCKREATDPFEKDFIRDFNACATCDKAIQNAREDYLEIAEAIDYLEVEFGV